MPAGPRRRPAPTAPGRGCRPRGRAWPSPCRPRPPGRGPAPRRASALPLPFLRAVGLGAQRERAGDVAADLRGEQEGTRVLLAYGRRRPPVGLPGDGEHDVGSGLPGRGVLPRGGVEARGDGARDGQRVQRATYLGRLRGQQRVFGGDGGTLVGHRGDPDGDHDALELVDVGGAQQGAAAMAVEDRRGRRVEAVRTPGTRGDPDALSLLDTALIGDEQDGGGKDALGRPGAPAVAYLL